MRTKFSQPVAKPHRLDGVPGLMAAWATRRTGARVQLLHTAQAGLQTAQKYTVRCLTHGQAVGCDTWVEGKKLGKDPAGWCEGCAAPEEVQCER